MQSNPFDSPRYDKQCIDKGIRICAFTYLLGMDDRPRGIVFLSNVSVKQVGVQNSHRRTYSDTFFSDFELIIFRNVSSAMFFSSSNWLLPNGSLGGVSWVHVQFRWYIAVQPVLSSLLIIFPSCIFSIIQTIHRTLQQESILDIGETLTARCFKTLM